MKRLTLSREYFTKTALPDFSRRFPDILPAAAAGLVGNGSECFGYDDMISRDHDWGVDFFIWLPENLSERIPEIAYWKTRLLEENPPEFPRTRSEYGARIGVETVGGFYKSLIGCAGCPSTLNEWISAPEANIAMAVNGEVFIDNPGYFTSIRNEILRYFPEDLRLKRLSYECMMLAQSGQYNFGRVMKRGDIITARNSLSRFSDAVIHTVFLLNRRFMPYYKWRAKALSQLSILGGTVFAELVKLAKISLPQESETAENTISMICSLISDRLRKEGLSSSEDWFMTSHGEELRAKISHDKLKALPSQYEI